MRAFVIVLILAFTVQLPAKVRILTFHYNKPDFIVLQHKSFQKFMLDDYEIIVFNDANTTENESAIEQTCKELGIECVRYQPEWHKTDSLNLQMKEWLDNPEIYSHIGFNRPPEGMYLEDISRQPSIRHSHVIQYAMDNYGYDHDDVVAIVDGDAFPIRQISLRGMLRNYDIFGIERLITEEDVSYLWVPFIAFQPKNLPNVRDLKFNVCLIGSKIYDTGAATYHYLKKYPGVRVKKYLGSSSTGYHHWNHVQLRQGGFTDAEARLIKNLPWPQCVEFHIKNHILHFGGSSFVLDGHLTKADWVTNFIDAITK